MTEGHFRVLLVYFSGVTFGAIGSLLLNPTQAIVGSSGGVYSLLFSHISQSVLVRNGISLFYKIPSILLLIMIAIASIQYAFRYLYMVFVVIISIQNWKQISYRRFRMAAVLILFFSDVLFVLLKQFYWSNAEPKISFIAHISGGAAGLCTGLIIFKRRINSQNSSPS